MNHRFLGVVFIVMIVFALWLVAGIFNQSFTSFDNVSLKTSTIGLQLPERADVKVRGVIVGQVLHVESKNKTAEVTLGIKPDMITEIPKNVSASILPKTLFGEKFIALDIPSDASKAHLESGDKITRTKQPIEVEKVLNDLYPLLRTVQPAELNYTLNALADALDGRGEKLGKSLVTLDGYLKRLNPQVPQLVADIKLLNTVATTYADVFPQLADVLRNTVKTGNTLRGREAKLNSFLKDLTSFSNTAKTFLDANGDNIIRLGKVSEPIVALLRRYAPEYKCLLEGVVGQAPLLAETFRGFIFHLNLKTIPRQPRGYTAADAPVFGADNPPNCAGLPHPSVPQPTAPNFNDGASGLGRGDGQRVAPGFAAQNAATAHEATIGDQDVSLPGISAGIAGTAAQKHLINSITAPVLGVPADQVPDLTTLLFAPAASGTEVSVQ